MTDNMPTFADGRTVRVSPFDGCQEICPRNFRRGRQLYTSFQNHSFRVTFHNVVRGVHAMWPPPSHVLETYHLQGIADAKRFLHNEGFYEPSTALNGVRTN